MFSHAQELLGEVCSWNGQDWGAHHHVSVVVDGAVAGAKETHGGRQTDAKPPHIWHVGESVEDCGVGELLLRSSE